MKEIWDQAEPTRAGFEFGRGTESVTRWHGAWRKFLRLAVCAEEKRIVETPGVVAEHSLKNQH